MSSDTKSSNVLDGSTWEFLRGGWWIVHVIALIAVFYLGRMWR
jgi:hypothetical protein